ncbi:hypothetical protein [Corynebacterium parakroppenstedtii]|uniref:hypothetical protein n=1 Tax=Corynebacterium parakroppenstedtii TaxID=2828363 RepID=UPI001C8F633B|nr:hypothetical protein [Corynebacterium parakroppenstedtii]MBY0795204.1 hypothetical protein [Corynebacterium parakroppenstedtii]
MFQEATGAAILRITGTTGHYEEATEEKAGTSNALHSSSSNAHQRMKKPGRLLTTRAKGKS